MINMKKLKINGADGGGQILRSALSLSMLTGVGFDMTNIRGKRAKPGLMRQHLMCVRAAKTLCNAEVSGDELGSQTLNFQPNTVEGGQHCFDIGSAGSTTLVAQTLILPLILATKTASSIEFKGGTHNPMAPSVDYLQHSYLALLASMGVNSSVDVHRIGFAPVGGGHWTLQLQPLSAHALKSEYLDFSEALTFETVHVTAMSSDDVPRHVNEREIKAVERKIDSDCTFEKVVAHTLSSGNYLSAKLTAKQGAVARQLVIDQLGSHKLSSERVAAKVVNKIQQLTHFGIDEHLANQIMLWMAVTGSGQFKLPKLTNHIKTHAALINQFSQASHITQEADREMIKVHALTIESSEDHVCVFCE
jgi:RNA 3'-terminal phosphate cyclase (ATP)